MKYVILALRPTQWIKNLFLFIPLIFGQKLFSYPENIHVTLAVLLFSLAASASYLINDLMDLQQDRVDPVKKLRPLPAGKITPSQALLLAATLAILCSAGAFALNPVFGGLVVAYLVLNVIYTKLLKRIVIVDVFCIAGFFLLRILAGGIVARVELSHWILFMGTLLALFLGFNKRRQELLFLGRRSPQHREVLSRYSIYFLDQMINVVTSSVVIVYMLYTVDQRTVYYFGSTHLVLGIPLVYYGIFRYLYLIQKLHRYGDPVRLLLSDRKLQINVCLWVMVNTGVIYFGW